LDFLAGPTSNFDMPEEQAPYSMQVKLLIDADKAAKAGLYHNLIPNW
jgi:hypothetical protein